MVADGFEVYMYPAEYTLYTPQTHLIPGVNREIKGHRPPPGILNYGSTLDIGNILIFIHGPTLEIGNILILILINIISQPQTVALGA